MLRLPCQRSASDSPGNHTWSTQKFTQQDLGLIINHINCLLAYLFGPLFCLARSDFFAAPTINLFIYLLTYFPGDSTAYALNKPWAYLPSNPWVAAIVPEE